jgi:protein involved in polysaccharide export with SLBB domain
MKMSLWIVLTTAAAMLLAAGCGSSSQRVIAAPPEVAVEAPPSSGLGPGDVIEVKFSYTPEFNQTQTVRPDGNIQLPLIGNVHVAGLTPSELRGALMGFYRQDLRDPDIVVIVQSWYNRRVFVGGEVLKPGIILIPGEMTVVEAIMEAGGFRLPEAEVRNIVVIRQRDNRRYGYCIDLEAATTGGDVRPFLLEPRDIVYVPRTRITKIGQWVDQHINKLVPQTGFLFTYRAGDATVGYDMR